MSGDSILVRQFSLVVMAIMLLLQSACATRQPDVAKPDNLMPDMSKSLNNPGWWRVQFVKHWPEGSPAPFSYDLLLAERVIQPVLKLHRDRIYLWRFHRRAGRDAAGSKFSFIFYTDADNARLITDEISSQPLLTELADNGIIEKIWVDDYRVNERPGISDTSDREWPEEIQESWPYFIMGVSQAWLALINKLTSRYPFPEDEDSIDEMLIYYSEVSNRIDQYWNIQGGHAYIHHLGALFAYRPVEARF